MRRATRVDAVKGLLTPGKADSSAAASEVECASLNAQLLNVLDGLGPAFESLHRHWEEHLSTLWGEKRHFVTAPVPVESHRNAGSVAADWAAPFSLGDRPMA